jgi:tryptophan halogenase
VGLASGFMEPLESTSIHFIQSSIAKLVAFFPDRRMDAVRVDEYNRQVQFEFERARDFLVLHYKATERNDSPFWDHCREMPVPDNLRTKMELFRETGLVFREADELFAETSWMQVMIGQNIMPRAYHPLVDTLSLDEIRDMVAGTRRVLERSVDVMPIHKEFIARFCKAEPVAFGAPMRKVV